jgi:hypothetical protein
MGEELTKEEIGYIAGIIDGEGIIRIARFQQTRRALGSFYRVVVSVANSDLRLMAWLNERLGGSVYRSRKGIAGQKTVWYWQLGTSSLVPFLRKIGMFLVVKGKQAALVHEFCVGALWRKGGAGRQMPAIERRRREMLFGCCTVLNRKGTYEQN